MSHHLHVFKLQILKAIVLIDMGAEKVGVKEGTRKVFSERKKNVGRGMSEGNRT